MTDYRNPNDPFYRDPNDPLGRDNAYDPDRRSYNATWGWIAGALFLVVVLAIAFGIGHEPGTSQTASNETNPPITRMAPPSMAPNPANPAPPVTPAPAPGATGGTLNR